MYLYQNYSSKLVYYLYALVTHENVCKFINIHGYQTSEKDLQNHITIGQGFFFL